MEDNLKKKIIDLSNDSEKLLELLSSIPQEKWDIDTIVIYVKAIVAADKLFESDNIDDIYDLLLSVADEGTINYEWNSTIANVCFNLQLQEESVLYQKQAIRLKGGNPDMSEENLSEIYEQVLLKLQDESLDEDDEDFSDEEYLAMYYYN